LYDQNTTEPIYFYIDVVFALHGLLLCSLFLTSWSLSQSWLAGVLTAVFYIFNRLIQPFICVFFRADAFVRLFIRLQKGCEVVWSICWLTVD